MAKQMNRFESRYFNTAQKMDKALIELLEEKEFEYITVNEICKRAGVNRSTFYLHYENITDLLNESVKYALDDFFENVEIDSSIVSDIDTVPLEKLVFISPDYLKPYLEYIKDHDRIFRTMLKQASVMRLGVAYQALFDRVLGPVLRRFGCPEEIHEYLMTFFIHGLIAVITQWLENGCKESVDEITHIIIYCVRPNIK